MITVGTRVQLRQPHYHAGLIGRVQRIQYDAPVMGRYRIRLEDGRITHAAHDHVTVVADDATQQPYKPTVWVTSPEDAARIEEFMARSRVKRLQKQLAEARRRGFAKTLVPLDLLDTLIQSLNTKKNLEEAA